MKIIPGRSDSQEFDSVCFTICLFVCEMLLVEVGGETLSVDIQNAFLSDAKFYILFHN